MSEQTYWWHKGCEYRSDLTLDGRSAVKELVKRYEEYVSKDEYMILRHKITKESDLFTKNPLLDELIAVKISKRGNDVYNKRLDERTAYIKDYLKGARVSFKKKGRHYTKMVFITLTWDLKLSYSIEEAWSLIGEMWNRYMSRLRKKFGHVSCMRVWEAFLNGYPHIHALLFFSDVSFEVKRLHEKDRIREYKDFRMWHSFVDVKAVLDFVKGYDYLMKYLTKVYHGSSRKYKITKALSWWFRKRSFFVSGRFMEAITDLNIKETITTNKNCSNLGQYEGENLIESWVFLSSMFGEDMGLSRPARWLTYKNGVWISMRGRKKELKMANKVAVRIEEERERLLEEECAEYNQVDVGWIKVVSNAG